MDETGASFTLDPLNFTPFLNTTENGTIPKLNKGIGWRPRIPVSSVVSFSLGVIGNILAIYVLFRSKKRHRWGVFYRFVIALAFTDLFGIITTSPVVFAVFSGKASLRASASLCHYMAFMMIFAGLATVLLVGAMALDRYFAVIHPFKYNAVDRYTTVNFVLFGIWFFSVLIALLPVFGLGENVPHYPFSWCFFNFFGHKVEDQIYGYFYSVLGLGTICVTAVLNCRVIAGLISGRRSTARRGSITSKKSRSRKDIFITIFLVAIFLVFTICWAPFMIRLIINQSRTVPQDRKADIIALILASWNQVLDPWIYLLFRHEMLKRFVHLITKSRGGSALRRLVSFTGSFRESFRSTSSGSEMTQDTQSRQMQIDSCVGEELSFINESKTKTTDFNDKRMIQDNVSISDEV